MLSQSFLPLKSFDWQVSMNGFDLLTLEVTEEEVGCCLVDVVV